MTSSFPCRLTRQQAVEFLQSRGYPVTLTWMNKRCMNGGGPRVDVYFSGRKRPLYRAEDLLEWVESAECQPAETAA
jgi:hypothetical protein